VSRTGTLHLQESLPAPLQPVRSSVGHRRACGDPPEGMPRSDAPVPVHGLRSGTQRRDKMVRARARRHQFPKRAVPHFPPQLLHNTVFREALGANRQPPHRTEMLSNVVPLFWSVNRIACPGAPASTGYSLWY
jgi:hypothetical protein